MTTDNQEGQNPRNAESDGRPLRWLYLNDPKLWSRKVELTGDCSVDCTEHCQYPGQFSECS